MKRPLWLNFTSLMEDMISEKNERLFGSSGSSNTENNMISNQKHKLEILKIFLCLFIGARIFGKGGNMFWKAKRLPLKCLSAKHLVVAAKNSSHQKIEVERLTKKLRSKIEVKRVFLRLAQKYGIRLSVPKSKVSVLPLIYPFNTQWMAYKQ